MSCGSFPSGRGAGGLFALRRRYALTIVANLDDDHVAETVGRHDDLCPDRAMADGIFDQIGKHLDEQFAITRHRLKSSDFALDDENFAVVFGNISVDLRSRGHDLAKVGAREASLVRAGLYLGESSLAGCMEA